MIISRSKADMGLRDFTVQSAQRGSFLQSHLSAPPTERFAELNDEINEAQQQLSRIESQMPGVCKRVLLPPPPPPVPRSQDETQSDLRVASADVDIGQQEPQSRKLVTWDGDAVH